MVVDPRTTTLLQAQQQARTALARDGACGVSVILLRGRHAINDSAPLVLGARDSGAGPGCAARWASAAGASISGGRALPDAAWAEYSPARGIWCAPLASAGLAVTSPGPRQLYVQGRRMRRAATPPNTTHTQKHGTSMYCC